MLSILSFKNCICIILLRLLCKNILQHYWGYNLATMSSKVQVLIFVSKFIMQMYRSAFRRSYRRKRNRKKATRTDLFNVCIQHFTVQNLVADWLVLGKTNWIYVQGSYLERKGCNIVYGKCYVLLRSNCVFIVKSA